MRVRSLLSSFLLLAKLWLVSYFADGLDLDPNETASEEGGMMEVEAIKLMNEPHFAVTNPLAMPQ